MARIVVIEPDPRVLQALGRALHGSGHAVDVYSDEMSALAELTVRPADLVIAAAGPGGSAARRAWSALEVLEAAPPIVWTGPVRAMVLPLIQAGRGVDFLETPPTRPAVTGLLQRLLGGGAAEDRWSGPGFLDQVDGDSERFPPARVLFLAHRVSASGTLTVGEGDFAWSVQLRKGRIIGCTGVLGLTGEQPPEADADAPDLMAALGLAIGRGADPDATMRTGGVAIARLAIATADGPAQPVAFAVAEAGRAPIQLPSTVPQLLAEAARQQHLAADVRRRWARSRLSAITLQPPDDAPESQWGLPPVALRLMRDAARVGTLGELLGAARGGETDEVWQAVDLLRCLGVLSIEEGTRPAAAPAPAAEVAMDDIEIEAIAPEPAAAPAPDGGPADDPEALLRAAYAAMKGADPWTVLGIDDPDQLEDDELESVFRKRSAEFHPDRFQGASARVGKIAAACFARVGEARAAFDDTDFLIETRQRLRARKEGRPFATESQKSEARLVAKRAEVAARKKQWDEAHRLWVKATEIDGTEVSYTWHRLESGWRAGVLPGTEVAKALLSLDGLTIGHGAEVYNVVGEIRLREGDLDGAYAAFTRCIELKPDHIDARRRLRLRDMRSKPDEAGGGGGKGLGALKGLFSFGRKGDKKGPDDGADS